ncbi:hypothetical protein MSPP1_003565 [Malassezia sp. CBS 17886]|nr:hypothetical protein MSPP1_003565 [Malassezia sp. CBS 17886]
MTGQADSGTKPPAAQGAAGEASAPTVHRAPPGQGSVSLVGVPNGRAHDRTAPRGDVHNALGETATPAPAIRGAGLTASDSADAVRAAAPLLPPAVDTPVPPAAAPTAARGAGLPPLALSPDWAGGAAAAPAPERPTTPPARTDSTKDLLTASPYPAPKSAPATPAPRLSPAEKEESGGKASDADAARRSEVGTLAYTHADFVSLLQSLPLPLHRMLPPSMVAAVARLLHLRGALATDTAFDLVLLFARTLSNVFFREIQPRSSWRIPRTGPIIFVGAPHHNQFLDPLLLASEVRMHSGRRVSFLVAQKSTMRPIIGAFSRLLRSISVVRAADRAKDGKGRIVRHPSGNPAMLSGIGTQFTRQLELRGQVVLPKETDYAAAQVEQILSDTEIRLKKELTGERVDAALGGALNADKSAGSTYKVWPYVDQREMYGSVYECLSGGGCLGIFPEGGSHDRTDLLPLKAGVVLMALGAMANDPRLDVNIVPVGLSYFHPHKFRSRAVVEFGEPIKVPKHLVAQFTDGGAGKRKATSEMLDIVHDGLKSVTVRAPDYETLMVIQAVRRLIKAPGQHVSLGDTVEMNRKFIVGYLKFRDHPRVVGLRDAVLRYNAHLRQVGIRDHQVDRARRSVLRTLALLLYRLGLLTFWSGCALPGFLLNVPIIILAKRVSAVKAKEALAASQVKVYGRDVLATWKVLVSLVAMPILYLAYAAAATVLARRRGWKLRHQLLMPLYCLVGLPAVSWGALRFGEVGVDVYKSLPPLFVSLLPGRRKVLDRLQTERRELAKELHSIMSALAPEGWDYESLVSAAPSACAPPARELRDPVWGRRSTEMHDSRGGLMRPLSYVDEWVFGWGSSRDYAGGDGSADGAAGEDEMGPDYDEVLSVYQDKTDEAASAKIGTPGRRPRRRSSQEYRRRRASLSSTGSESDLPAVAMAALKGRPDVAPPQGVRAGAPGDRERRDRG